MDFIISDDELAVMYGLPHIQQLAYLRGIRPYLNVKTGLVGVERGISYQSIAEQLYVEPHQGIKSVSYSRAQIRRAIAGLERAGLVQSQSDEHKLILKCLLANQSYSVQKKAVTKPSQKGGRLLCATDLDSHGDSLANASKPDTVKTEKAGTPHKDPVFLYLFKQFEIFWSHYPSKKSKQKAKDAFVQINPDDALFNQMLAALDAQIKNRDDLEMAGNWVPPWKYPANWLAQHCWNDELTPVVTTERSHAKSPSVSAKKSSINLVWNGCSDASFEFEDEQPGVPNANNIVRLQPVRAD
jgi:hypothetical protein